MPNTRVYSSSAKHPISRGFDHSGCAARHRRGGTAARGAHSDAQEQAMNAASERIERGLKEALAQAQREEREGPVAIEKIDVPEPDVKAIRASTGLSRAEFARSIGVEESTLLDWERRRRRPEGTARVLLDMIAGDPRIAHRAPGGESAD